MDVFVAEVRRNIQATQSAVQRAIISALEAMNFTIDRAGGSIIEAHTGSQWLLRVREKRPIMARATVMQFADVARMTLHLKDAESIVLDTTTSSHVYERLFSDIISQIDNELLAIDPQLSILQPLDVSESNDLPSRQKQLSSLIQRVGKGTKFVASSSPGVLLTAPGGYAILSDDEVSTLLAIAAVAATDPSIPVTLLELLEVLQADLRRVASFESRDAIPEVRVDSRGRRLVDFMYRQRLARDKVPMRERHRCRDCGQERIANPDLQKGPGKRAVWDLAGAATSLAYNPFAVVSVAGRIAAMRSPGRTFTCNKCQGTNVEVTPATICPQCHKIITDPVLRRCPTESCGYDFLASLDDATLWRSDEHDEPSRATAAGGARRAAEPSQDSRQSRKVLKGRIDAARSWLKSVQPPNKVSGGSEEGKP